MFTLVNMIRLRSKIHVGGTLIHALVLAVLFTISSLFWTKDTAYDVKTIKQLEFGWPFPFIVQNQEKFDPPFPHKMLFGWELSAHALEQPAVKIIWGNAFSSAIFNFFTLFAVLHAFTLFKRRTKH